MCRRSQAVLLAFGAGLCSAGRQLHEPVGGTRSEVEVIEDTAAREAHFAIVERDCRISWTVYRSEANRGVIRHWADCGQALGEQARLIGEVLQKMRMTGAGTEFRTLSWGRLHPDGARDVTMPLRLAQAALESAEWDSAKGRPRSRDINGFIRALANDAVIYRELRPVFERAGLEISVASVEKVLVLPAGRLPFYEALKKAGVRAEQKLPFDCQTWFSVRR